MGKVAKWRRSRKARLLIIIVFLVIAGILAYMFEKTRWIMIGTIVLLLTALGFEVSQTDFDLGTLWETGSLAESRVRRSADGDLLIGETCEQDAFNCDDFANQEEAQEVFEACNWGGADPHGLDRNKNNIACESLKSAN